jgi:hypothetical protein
MCFKKFIHLRPVLTSEEIQDEDNEDFTISYLMENLVLLLLFRL